jgi:hypothetical protein
MEQLASAALQVAPLESLCCSNHMCVALAGLSELVLVAGRGLCGGCGKAKYCSRACQQQNWPWHKEICKAHRYANARKDGR